MATSFAGHQKKFVGRAAGAVLGVASVAFALALFIPMLIIVFDGPCRDRA